MAEGWGGSRPGAGRKKRDPNAPKAVRSAPKPQLATVGGRRLPSFQEIAALVEASRNRVQDRRADLSPFRLPTFPKFVLPPRRQQMAADSALAANLAFCNNDWLAAGQFTSNISAGMIFMGYPYLSELAQQPEYRTISEIIATESTRKWIRLQAVQKAKGAEKAKGGSEEGGPEPNTPEADLKDEEDQERQDKANRAKADRIKELGDELNRLQVRDRMTLSATNDGLFGRTHLYLDFDIDTDGDPEELVNPVGDGSNEFSVGKIGKGSFKRLKVVEPAWVYPQMYNANNPLRDDWYKPQAWYVMGKQIHASRLLTMIARPVPDMLKPAFAFGGLSLSQIAKPYIDIWLRTRQSVGDLIHSFSVMVLHTDLATMTAPGGGGVGGDLLARIALFNMLRDNNGAFVVNKETEDFKNVSAPISGLAQLQAQAQEHIASIARIPLVKFTGITPEGLNASSEGEIRVFYDTIAAFQQSYFRPPLQTIINFAMLSLWGEIDKDLTFEFEPLWEMTAKERSEIQKAEADRNQVYIDSGVLSPEEIRKAVIDDPELPFTALDPDDVPELKEEEMEGLIPEGAGKGLEAVLGEGEAGPKKPGGEGGGQDAVGLRRGGAGAGNEGNRRKQI